MSFMGGGKSGEKDKVKMKEPPPGMMYQQNQVHYGNPQNMPEGTRRFGVPALIVPKAPGWGTPVTKDKKNSLISGRMK